MPSAGEDAMTREQLQFWQLASQHLIQPVDYRLAVRDVCGVQAQFYGHALHALRIRSLALPERPEGLVKSWTLRGTMHAFAVEDLPLFFYQGRRRALRPCDTLDEDANITGERKRYFARQIVEGIAEGICTREALKQRCLAAGMTEQESESVFNPWGGTIRALCESGVICHRMQEEKSFQLCPSFTPMAEQDAKLELTRRYVASFGPVTVQDAAYFFRISQREAGRYLAQLPAREIAWQGRRYYAMGPEPEGELPVCRFLAGFDQLLLGHQKTESLFLPPAHLRAVFSLAGMVAPTVLLRGSVVGKWKRQNQKRLITLLEPVSPEDRQEILREARQLWPEADVAFV